MKDLRSIIAGFDNVVIQTHNFPDADAIASAYGIKRLIQHWGKPAEIIFYGNNVFKPNIENMVNRYRIKMTNIGEEFMVSEHSLLLIVDGQRGAGNMFPVTGKHIAVIDHHLEEKPYPYLYKDIQPKVGACTTLVVNYLKENGYEIDKDLATILYFGIFMDTDMFNGKMTTLDNDAKKELESNYDKNVIDQLRLSSMTFNDLKIYANGILKTERYNNIIFSSMDECEDNLLGHFSDLLSEIDGVDIVVVYSSRPNGFKISIRSYHSYLTAEELVKELTEGVGTGGGHINKAGGFVPLHKYNETCPNVSFNIYVRTKIIDYFWELRLLETGKDDPFAVYGRENFVTAGKKNICLRYIDIKDHFKGKVTIKTLEGTVTATVDDKVMIGVKGEIWPISEQVFYQKYEALPDKEITCVSERYIDQYGITIQSETDFLRITEDNIRDCKVCRTTDQSLIKAFQLNERVKVRTTWGDFLAKKGDYLMVNDLNDYYICDREVFELTYELKQ